MRLDFPGLVEERLPSGGVRLRVRVKGQASRRVTLTVKKDHPRFQEHYLAARQGVQLQAEPEVPGDGTIEGSLNWICDLRLADLERKVGAGLASKRTLAKRRALFRALSKKHGHMAMAMPRHWVFKIRDGMLDRPDQADAMVEAIRELYRWASDVGHLPSTFQNPALNIPRIGRKGSGAVPWTVDDLRSFRKHWAQGTTPYVALTLLMFAAPRIGDARVLGRSNEFVRDGVRGLAWQPEKKGSAFVEIPMMPQLYRATREMTVEGTAYILKQDGQPYGSSDSMSAMFIRWCKDAGLKRRSAHGVRKAAGNLMAEQGMSQHQIMAVHGHAEARTSEIYTKGARRWIMASEAVKALESLEW